MTAQEQTALPDDRYQRRTPGGQRTIAKRTFTTILEVLITAALCGLVVSIYFPRPSINQFGLISLLLLLLWRYALRNRSERTIPLPVVVLSVLFFLSLVLSAEISQNKEYYFFEYKAFKYFIIGGLLVISTLSDRYRKIIIVVLFIAAAIDGFIGVLQYVILKPQGQDRLFGFATLSTIYAAKLAFVAGASSLLLLYRERDIFRFAAGTIFLVFTAVLTWSGILLSGSRGTWLALPAALLITLCFMNLKKALLVLCALFVVMIAMVSLDANLRTRMASLVNAESYADARGSLGNRVELLKGAYILFRSSPVLGVGSGDFQSEIETLKHRKEIPEIPYTIHAHNIYFHILATEGIVGLLSFVALCVSLLLWGRGLMRMQQDISGYMVFFTTLLVMLSGLTDYYFASPHYASLWFMMIGLFAAIDSRSKHADART